MTTEPTGATTPHSPATGTDISAATAAAPAANTTATPAANGATDTTATSPQEAFRDQLIQAGLLFPTGLDGLYGRGATFERVLLAVEDALTRAGERAADLTPGGQGYTVYRFAPVFPRHTYEKTDYIESFPDLTGAVHTFSGGNKEHRQLLSARSKGEDWDHFLSPGETMLVSAACHPVYEQMPKTLPAEGAAVDVSGYCFRHEPSLDPMRMQSFRMREFVRVGTAATIAEHRASWLDRAEELLTSFGLPVAPVAANDPFFGRAGTMLAQGQLEANLKTEFVVPIYGDAAAPTAIASCNDAQDHFGHKFGLSCADGSVAHTTCSAFGLERTTLALFATHGMNPASWPAAVREALAL